MGWFDMLLGPAGAAIGTALEGLDLGGDLAAATNYLGYGTHPSLGPAPWGKGNVQSSYDLVQANDPMAMGGASGSWGGGTRRRLLSYTPGMQWPGPGWGRPVYLPARRPTSGRDAGWYLRRSRRMNPLNIHALRRAIRRTESATHTVKRLLHLHKSITFRKGAKGPCGRKKR